jgi:hypothetical protein
MTGDVVGRVQGVDTRKIELGGRDRDVVHHRDGRILTDAARGGQPARFRPNGSPSVSLALGRAGVEGLGVAPGEIALVTFAGEVRLLHGLGTLGALLFLELLSRAGTGPSAGDTGAYMTLVARAPEELPRPSEEDVVRFVEEREGRLARIVAAGPWRRGVPRDVHLAALRRMSGLDEVVRLLCGAKLQRVEAPGEDVLRVLETI